MSEMYRTIAINDSRIKEESRIENEWKIRVTSVHDDEPGANPEQFMGMAWATCMNLTVQALLKARGATNNSKVRVEVRLHPEPGTRGGLYFALTAFVSVEGFTTEQSEQIADQAHRRCPVSKLIHANEHVDVQVEDFL